MNNLLENRKAIVTGGSQGLGYEIAYQFVASGADVMICGRSNSQLKKAINKLRSIANNRQKIFECRADVSNKDDVKNLVNETIIKLGGCQILVNNAGIYGPKGPIENIEWDEWIKALNININGSVLMCKEIIPYFKEQGYGKIIQLSGGGATNPLPNISSYAVSKAAIVRFAETIAEELRDFGIDVNSIAPGALNTGMLDEIILAGEEKVGKKFYQKSLEQKNSGGTPLQYSGELAVFLASAESDGITAKLISAVWDKWRNWPKNINKLNTTDIYTLRRITGRDRDETWGDK
jgi:NAD(P)-dependent dehydrogenase (short-subunit alcohol dehydrogenase family)